MSRNNIMYTMFKQMKQGYANNNMDDVEQCARCWLRLDPENPFQENTPEYEAFFQMQKSYIIWMRGDIDRKLNRRKMRRYAIELCSLNPKQPYRYNKEEEQLELEEQKAKEEERRKKIREKEQLKDDEFDIANNVQPKLIKQVKTEKQVVLGVPQENEDKKSWLRFLHPWRKDDKNDSP